MEPTCAVARDAGHLGTGSSGHDEHRTGDWAIRAGRVAGPLDRAGWAGENGADDDDPATTGPVTGTGRHGATRNEERGEGQGQEGERPHRGAETPSSYNRFRHAANRQTDIRVVLG